jgi:hypothetical protein
VLSSKSSSQGDVHIQEDKQGQQYRLDANGRHRQADPAMTPGVIASSAIRAYRASCRRNSTVIWRKADSRSSPVAIPEQKDSQWEHCV